MSQEFEQPFGNVPVQPISVADALKFVELSASSLLQTWRFSLAMVSAIFIGGVSGRNDMARLEIGIKWIVCLAAWVLFLSLWAGLARNRRRLMAGFELVRLAACRASPDELRLIETLTSRLVLPEHVILLVGALFTLMMFWSEITARI